MKQNPLKILVEATRARLGLRSREAVVRAAGLTPTDYYNALRGRSEEKAEILRQFCRKA